MRFTNGLDTAALRPHVYRITKVSLFLSLNLGIKVVPYSSFRFHLSLFDSIYSFILRYYSVPFSYNPHHAFQLQGVFRQMRQHDRRAIEQRMEHLHASHLRRRNIYCHVRWLRTLHPRGPPY